MAFGNPALELFFDDYDLITGKAIYIENPLTQLGNLLKKVILL